MDQFIGQLQQKKCIRAALRFDSDNKNLSRFPVDFTGTSGEVFLLDFFVVIQLNIG